MNPKRQMVILPCRGLETCPECVPSSDLITAGIDSNSPLDLERQLTEGENGKFHVHVVRIGFSLEIIFHDC